MLANLLGPDGLTVLIIAVVVLVGGSQLPKLARNLGVAGKEFRKAQTEAEEEHAKEQANKQAQAAASAATVTPIAPTPSADADKVTLTRDELDALLAARENKARSESKETAK